MNPLMGIPARKPDESLNEFFAECEELSERISNNLSLLEKGNYSHETLDSLYRDMHTIKGSAYLMGIAPVGEIAHAMETCLDPVRNRESTPTPNLTRALAKCLDQIDLIVKAFREQQEIDFSKEVQAVVIQLVDASLETAGGNIAVKKEQPAISENLEVKASAAPEASAEIVAPKLVAVAQSSAPVDLEKTDSSSTIRVPVTLLDKLMTLMGEMVLVRNQVLQYSSRSDNLEFLNLSQRLDVVTSELQGEVMKTRMQPIGNVLGKFQRVVRDLGRDLNKRIELSLSGSETELDKTLLEAVKDPLTHIIRNSCDHGIEMPEDRRKAGKPETGRVSIRSFHEGGQVIVEISDDGRGLDRDKLIAKALEKGILAPEKASALSEREAFALIFAPGFSTAAQVTNVSGRGVGMDVVKSNIEKIGGMVELSSQLGKGTTIRLKIPLTLAIVPAMIVRSEQDLYAIPQVKLVELVRVEKSASGNQIEYLQGKPVYRLRGNILPLVSLQEVLGADSDYRSLPEVVNIVVLQSERQMFGLIVDEIKDTADIVVKPLSRFLKTLSVYSGATVLGDGSVALILDVIGIAHRMQLAGESQGNVQGRDLHAVDSRGISTEAQEFLLFRLNAQAKHALPLNLVHRLEEFKSTSIEMSGSQRVMRYRNSILPLVSLNELLGYGKEPSREVVPVIVISKSGRLFGIEVNEILDVLSTELRFDDAIADRREILGNLVTKDEVVVIVDALRMLDQVASKLGLPSGTGGGQGGQTESREAEKIKVLFVEDTVFFRKHVTSVLEKAGFQVFTAIDGLDALEKLEAGDVNYDLILSDIEMPRMNGLQLASRVRKLEKWKNHPVVALTTRFNDRHAEEGREAGFDQYLEKMDPEKLLSTLTRLLASKKGARHV